MKVKNVHFGPDKVKLFVDQPLNRLFSDGNIFGLDIKKKADWIAIIKLLNSKLDFAID